MRALATTQFEERSATTSSPPEALWAAVDHLLEGADVEGIRVHRLGPLAARRLRRLGRPVPPLLEAEGRVARLATMSVVPLLSRIRSSCEGPLVLFKGPEIARLYPGKARAFVDVDLLTPNAGSVHRALKSTGFVEVDDPELFRDHYHLRPLQWPAFSLKVEIHTSPNWPSGFEPPSLSEIVAAAVPSGVGVEGISAPDSAQHALILAAHAWVHEPLHTLRDLVDIAAVSDGASEDDLGRAARAWGIGRIWRTTRSATDAVFGGTRRTVPLRLWARHLAAVRERTVVDEHLQRWLHSYWELPLDGALGETARTFRAAVLPKPEENWSDKMIRVTEALRHPRARASSFDERVREAVRDRDRSTIDR